MRTQLVVEENVVDLNDELAAQLTFAIDDIKDFASRNTSYSKTINIPGTAQNNFIFGHLCELDVFNTHNPLAQNVGFNYNAAKSAKCEVLVDYMLLFKGVIRVLQVNIEDKFIEYECSLVGELGGLAYAIEGKKLEELDFSAYDHSYTLANIQASWSGTPGSGYYYPLIDYGYSADGKAFEIETFRPAFYVKEYLDKIFTAAGYTYESVFLNAAYFKNLIIPFNELYPSVKAIATLSHRTIASKSGNQPFYFQWNTGVGNNYFVMQNSNQDLVWTRSGTIHVRMTFQANYSANGIFNIKMYKSGTVVHEQWHTGNGAINMYVDLDIAQNEGVYVQYFVNGQSGTTFTNAVLKIEGLPTVNLPFEVGDFFFVNDAIPKNILQKDFITSLVKMFNLYIYEDRDKNKHLKIEPYINFYSKTELLDWTKKVDYSKKINIKPLSEINSRKYEFKFKDDSDYYNDLYKKKYGTAYGNRVYDTTYDFVKDTKSLEVIFSPTPLVQVEGQSKIISAIYKKNDAGVSSPTPSNIRILSRSESMPVAAENWTIINNGATIFTGTSYPYAGHFSNPITPLLDLNFGSPSEFYFTFSGTGYLSFNLFNVYWSAYMSEIADKDSKLLLAYSRLTSADIQQLDFSKLIFINGQIFRLNKVEDYDAGEEKVTKIELLNVINIDFASAGALVLVNPDGEFNDDFNSDFNIGG